MTPFAYVGLALAGLWLITAIGSVILTRGDSSSGALGLLLIGWGWPVVIPFILVTEVIDRLRRKS